MRAAALVIAACAAIWLCARACQTGEPPSSERAELVATSTVAGDHRAAVSVAAPVGDALADVSEIGPRTASAETATRALRGVVRWPDGAIAGGARVEACSVALDASAPKFSVATRADESTGEFVLEGATSACIVIATSYGTPPLREPAKRDSEQTWTAGPMFVDDPARACDLVLDPGVKLSGSARDDQGRYVDDYLLEAFPCAVLADGTRHVGSFANERRATGGGRGGSFTWNGLGRGTWAIVAWGDEHARGAVAYVDLGSGPREVDFVLPRLARIEGLVVDETGAPLANTRVGVEYAEAEAWLALDVRYATMSDLEGHFVLGSVRPGVSRLVCGATRVALDWRSLAPAQFVDRLHVECDRQ